MMQAPLVSVLMPVYNGEKYLKAAIESILNQTFSDFEFLIINDGSTDQSEEIIHSFKDRRIIYFKNDQNLKIIETLNKGLKLATGKYIARMDADDFSLPNRLQVQVDFMENNPDYGLCGSNIEIVEENKGATLPWVKIGDHDYLKFCLLFQNVICHPTAFIRRSVLVDHRLSYEKKYLHAEEYGLWFQLSRYSKLFNLQEKLLHYRIHGEQVSVLNSSIQTETVNRIKTEIFRDLVLFSIRPIDKLELILTAGGILRERVDEEDVTYKFGQFDYFEAGLLNKFRLIVWLYLMRISLIFHKDWNSQFVKSWIDTVRKVAASKSKLFRA